MYSGCDDAWADGLEVCRRFAPDTSLHHVPILFLTARSHTDDIVSGLDAGGDDYVVKPSS